MHMTCVLCVRGGGGGRVQERLGAEALPVELYLRETGTPDWLSMVSHDRDTNLVTMTVCVRACVFLCVSVGVGVGLGLGLGLGVGVGVGVVS
jgi:hypothetical protein